jgi:hypothetical protein
LQNIKVEEFSNLKGNREIPADSEIIYNNDGRLGNVTDALVSKIKDIKRSM